MENTQKLLLQHIQTMQSMATTSWNPYNQRFFDTGGHPFNPLLGNPPTQLPWLTDTGTPHMLPTAMLGNPPAPTQLPPSQASSTPTERPVSQATTPTIQQQTTAEPDGATPTRSPLTQITPTNLNAPRKYMPLPITSKKSAGNALPSAVITDWEGRKSVKEVIENNHKLTKLSKISTLALKISRDALFGENVMKKCTALGCRELPGLPRAELYQLKQALFELFPCYWKNPDDFEVVWSECIDAIGQLCKRLRRP